MIDKHTPVELRVRYAETDQMGVAYHSHYLVWCEVARTDLMRQLGVTYRILEEDGVRLAVVDARVRYRAAARYDDLLRVHAWVRDSDSRRVVFGYWVERIDDSRCLATAETSLIAIDSKNEVTRIPAPVRKKLVPTPDPVRL